MSTSPLPCNVASGSSAALNAIADLLPQNVALADLLRTFAAQLWLTALEGGADPLQREANLSDWRSTLRAALNP